MVLSDIGPANIVVVDDAPANLILLANILEGAGHEVRVANSAQRALSLIGREPPDLVLLDVNLPDKDGYQVCRELKAKDALKAIPVVFLSADDDDASKTRALEAGGVEYLVKPFEAADILARIGAHLRLARALKDLTAERDRAERFRVQAKATFEALCAALAGTSLNGSYRVGTRATGPGERAFFEGTRLKDGAVLSLEFLPPGRSSVQGAEHDDSVIDRGVSEVGVPYLVRASPPNDQT